MPPLFTVTVPWSGSVVFANVRTPPEVVVSLPATLLASGVSSLVAKLACYAVGSATGLTLGGRGIIEHSPARAAVTVTAHDSPPW